MSFEAECAAELADVLPAGVPHRDDVIVKSARHLGLIDEANKQFNLTRITTPREAAIKHVLDSVLPWRHFAAARHVLDAGTGAGFPGIPLAIALAEVRFTLCESTQKKARFVESAVEALELSNVVVSTERAEDLVRGKGSPFDCIAARAVAPVARAIVLLAPALGAGVVARLYKGPDAEAEIEEARAEAKRRHIRARIVDRYELPDGLGSRTLVELTGAAAR